MNTNILPSLALLALLSACGSANGDGVRHLGGYTSVTNKSDADVELQEDKDGDDLDPGDLEIVCEGGISADVATSVDSDGNLVIDFAAEVASILGCEVRVISDGVVLVTNDGDGVILCPDGLHGIRTIEVKGNGAVDLAAVETEELDLLVAGNGSLNIDDVQVETLNIDLRGTGDASLAGNAVNATLSISGSGSLAAQELTVSETLDAVLTGTGNAVITVLGTVNAEVHGDAELQVYGGGAPGDISEVDGGTVTFY